MIRQLIRNLSRFMESSIMNTIGLTIAFASSILILMQVKYELSYDKCYQDDDRIYTLEGYDEVGKYSYKTLPRPYLNIIQSNVPIIEYVALEQGWYQNSYIEITDTSENKNTYTFHTKSVTSDYIKIFGFEILEGDTSAMTDQYKAIIPRSFAEKISPGKSVIGKSLRINSHPYTIGAVYKDFPKNNSIGNTILTMISPRENIENYQNFNYNLYLKLKEDCSVSEANKDITNALLKFCPKKDPQENDQFKIIPIKDVHYKYQSGSHTLNILLISISILILTMSAINFFNFATSLVPMRVKSVNMYKIFGSSLFSLRMEILLEAVVLSCLSLFLSICIISLYQLFDLSSAISADLSFVTNVDIYVIMFFAAILLGVLSSLSPAIYITSFKPSILLSGNFALSQKGKLFRHLLVGVQFFASMSLFAAAIFLNMQYNYIMQKDLGYNTKQIAILNLNQHLVPKSDLIKEKLLQNKDISDVTFSQFLFGGSSDITEWSMNYSKGNTSFFLHPVAFNFLDFMGIQINSGRDFEKNDEEKEMSSYIMNQTAQNQYQFEESEILNGFGKAQIVGVCEDVIFDNVKNKIDPMAFYLYGKEEGNWLSKMYIKINNNMSSSIDYIKKTVTEIDPTYPFDYQFYDQYFESIYKKESDYRYLLSQFSLLAIFISLIGVYGLVKFDTQFKRKEIAIRKINGATVRDVLFLFCKSYLKIALICFVLSIPTVYYGISVWLQTFEYRTEIHWWVFPIVFVIELIIILTTVILQSYKAATENPSTILK